MTKKYRISAVFEDFVQLQVLKTRNGQEYELFCMENDISKEELYEMALEIK